MTHNVYRNGKVHVMGERCSTCIFHAGNRMNLRSGRVVGMVRDALRDNSAIVCHSTLDGDNAVCAGFFAKHKTVPLRLAEATNLIEYTTQEVKMRHRPLTTKQKAALDCIAWGVRHFGSMVTNRQVTSAVVMSLCDRGLVKSVGQVAVCDDDGFIITPERYREGFALTPSGEECIRLMDIESRKRVTK